MGILTEKGLASLNAVRCALTRPLPGIKAQQIMAPQPRTGWNPYAAAPPTSRWGAVLVLLYPCWGQMCFVLTRRSQGLPTHRGQVSLPGGGWQDHESLAETALRETHEELGIPTHNIEVLGELSSLYVPVSNYLMHTYVGYQSFTPEFQPNPAEVEDVLEVSLASLLDPSNQHEEHWNDPEFEELRRIPCFKLNDWTVWGATAMILRELVVMLEQEQDLALVNARQAPGKSAIRG